MSNDIQKKAESCMKEGNFTEAFIHWTHAIKVNPNESKFYFERSKCFLQQEQYYFALQDAESLIRINPKNYQGYLRKAEVLFATEQFSKALPLIQRCFTLSNDKEKFMEWSRRCKREILKKENLEKQFPFVGAAVGIVLATLGVVWDFLVNGLNSAISSPVLKVAIIVAVASVFYWFALLYRKHTDGLKKLMLQPPIDIFDEDKDLHQE